MGDKKKSKKIKLVEQNDSEEFEIKTRNMKKHWTKRKSSKKPSKESKSSNIADEDLESIIRSDIENNSDTDAKTKRPSALEDIKKKRAQKIKPKIEKQINEIKETNIETAESKTKEKRKRLKRLHKDTHYSDSE